MNRKVFVISDTHFWHRNIIKYCDRPFFSVCEMNDAMIERWNSVVGSDDIVIFCGDFCFARKSVAADVTRYLTESLNGIKIIVKGNHDFKKLQYCQLGWVAEFYQELSLRDTQFIHVPFDLESRGKQFAIVFYGHVHNHTVEDQPGNCYNVSADVLNFTPWDITHLLTDADKAILGSIANVPLD